MKDLLEDRGLCSVLVSASGDCLGIVLDFEELPEQDKVLDQLGAD